MTKAVPQSRQNHRSALSLDRRFAGSPAISYQLEVRQGHGATITGAPAALWHIRQ